MSDEVTRPVAATVAAYGLAVVVLAVAFALVVPAGQAITPAPEVPERLAVTGAEACLGETLVAEQSGVFVTLRGDGDTVFSGRIDTETSTIELTGTCTDDATEVGFTGVLEGATTISGELDASGDRIAVTLTDAGPDAGATDGDGDLDGGLFARVLLSIAVVIIVARLCGELARRIGQPRVAGEIVAGILLGPTLLGLIAPEIGEFLFPTAVTDVLGIFSELGLVFFMFLIGLELDHRMIRGSGSTALMISHYSIIFPLVLGLGGSLLIYPLIGAGDFLGFALFMGAAMAITAFPVLARILTDTGLHKTRLGALSIASAAIDDVTAWCVLAVVVAIVNSGGPGEAIVTVVLSLAFMAVMVAVVRPVAGRLFARLRGGLGSSAMALSLIMAGLFLSAWATEAIGIHAIFGAFIFGAILPREGGLTTHLIERFEDITVVVLLPIFFAVVGLSTQVGLVSGTEMWLLTGFVIVIAVIGKIGGSIVAGRISGESLRGSAVVGILMNARGVTGIIILMVGRELGVISPALFAVMVLMALVTTFMTTPLLSWVYPRRLVERDMLIQHHRSPSEHERRVMVGVTDAHTARPLVKIAGWFRDQQERPPTVLLAAVVSPPGHEHVRASIEDLAESNARAAGNLGRVVDALDSDGIRAEVMTRVGTDPVVELDLLTRQQGVDVLLIGAHEGYLRRRPLGGVVRGLLATVTCDVIVVLRGEQISGNDGPVGAVISGDAGDIAVVESARSIARGRDQHLVVIRPTGVEPDPAVLWDDTDVHAGPEAAADVSMLVVEGPDEDRIEVVERMSAARRLPVLVLRPAAVTAAMEGAKT